MTNDELISELAEETKTTKEVSEFFLKSMAEIHIEQNSDLFPESSIEPRSSVQGNERRTSDTKIISTTHTDKGENLKEFRQAASPQNMKNMLKLGEMVDRLSEKTKSTKDLSRLFIESLSKIISGSFKKGEILLDWINLALPKTF